MFIKIVLEHIRRIGRDHFCRQRIPISDDAICIKELILHALVAFFFMMRNWCPRINLLGGLVKNSFLSIPSFSICSLYVKIISPRLRRWHRDGRRRLFNLSSYGKCFISRISLVALLCTRSTAIISPL